MPPLSATLVPKTYGAGTHRACAPAETLSRLQPLLSRFGITRVANLTGLDRTGLPVVAVVRPNARSSAVFHGKGLDLTAAKVSGIMEAIETWHAEHLILPLMFGSIDELRGRLDLIEVNGLPRRQTSTVSAHVPLLWAEGVDLLSNGPTWVPIDVVHAHYTVDGPSTSGCLAMTTNGLASGNNLHEAVSHGLCEVIERDATSLWRASSADRQGAMRLDLASITDVLCADVLAQFARAKLDVAVWDMTTDVGVPAYQCLIEDSTRDAGHIGSGAGCHPSRRVALLRALTEAAQVRMTYIVGSREDLVPGDYTAAMLKLRHESVSRMINGARGTRGFEDRPSFEFETFNAEVAWLLERVRGAGLRQVVMVDLSHPGFDLAVARIIVPFSRRIRSSRSKLRSWSAPCQCGEGLVKRVCVFVGPTLSQNEVVTTLDAICLPPVAQGDVYRAVQRYRPEAIGIIDGFFAGAPAVWHKEILWALSEGIAVFGSASMGALRAAELHPFGMRGVGRIFEAYRDGQIEDDDEVAVIHGPAEVGYVTLSEPMVNIRATLARAETEAVLSASARMVVETVAKSLFFADRSWPTILEGARDRKVSLDDIASFETWLETGTIDLKRADALAMLAAMRAFGEGDPLKAPTFHFEATHFWTELTCRPESSDCVWPDDTNQQGVLDELRLGSHAVFQTIKTRALLRFASEMASANRGANQVDAEQIARATSEVRAMLGLYHRATFDAWLEKNDLDVASFQDLAKGSAALGRLSELAAPVLARFLLDELRLSGDYVRLTERARRKRARLANEASPGVEALSSPERLALRLWFSERRLVGYGDADLDTMVKALGFADAEHLDRSLHLERLYLTVIAPAVDD